MHSFLRLCNLVGFGTGRLEGTTVCSKKSDTKIEITILCQILSELNILLAALIITFLVQMLQISAKSTVQFLSNSCLKNGTKK